MTIQRDFAQPRIAGWLVSLFATSEEAESLLGDMEEEFRQLVQKSGVDFARSWYWRQTRKTVVHLAGNAFRAAPWLIAATVIGGLLLRRLLFGPPEWAIFDVLQRYGVFDRHFNVYVFFATYGTAGAHVVMSMFVACVVAWAARGSEMAATIALALALCLMTVAGLVGAVVTRNARVLHMLPWYLADWLAIVIGGAIVRMRRSAATHARSAT